MNTHFSKRLEKILLIGMDIVLLYSGYFLVTWFSYQLSPSLPNSNHYFFYTILCVFTFYLFDLYENWKRKSLNYLILTIVLAMLTFTSITFLFTIFISKVAAVNILLLASLFQFFLIGIGRLTLWHINKFKYGKKNVLVVSKTNSDGQKVVEKFYHHHQGWFQVTDIVTTQNKVSIKKYFNQIDVVVISSEVSRSMQAAVINLCTKNGKEVLVVPQLYELALMDAQMQQVDDMMVLSISPPINSGFYQLLKRGMDIVISASLMIILSPVLIGLYILIPVASKGPAFFSQERIGLNGRTFNILKFRSMVEDAEKFTGPVLALDRDPRVTPVGRVIRSLRIDELPQLLNVLKGDMSLIGPRPERSFFINQFKKEIPEYVERFRVKPGITGLAQVYASYSTTVEDKLRYDLMYIRNGSIILDFKILLQTIRVVLYRKQANGIVIKKESEHKVGYGRITAAKHN